MPFDDDCAKSMRARGQTYPRTCELCGLGPCHYYSDQTPDDPIVAVQPVKEVQPMSAIDWTPLMNDLIMGVQDGQISGNAAVKMLVTLLNSTSDHAAQPARTMETTYMLYQCVPRQVKGVGLTPAFKVQLYDRLYEHLYK